MSEKARYWTAVIYPEQLIDNWKSEIDNIFQFPYCYILHDKDYNDSDLEKRKLHYHFIIAFSNTTTYKHALDVFQQLCIYDNPVRKCERVMNIKYMWNYLIHDTESSKKANKHLYDKIERITGNNFDIGALEQLGVTDKEIIINELEDFIINNCITDYQKGLIAIKKHYEDSNYRIIYRQNGSHFERLCKGNYLDLKFSYEENIKRQSNLISKQYKKVN